MKKLLTYILPFIFYSLVLQAQPTQEWFKRYSFESGYNHNVVDMVLDAQGNSYTMGYIKYNNDYQDLFLIKYLDDGSLSWARKYSGGDSTKIIPVALIIDKSGNVIAGTSILDIRNDRVSQDFLTFKYNPYGDTIWSRRYNYVSDTSVHYRYSIPGKPCVDNSNNIYVSGTSPAGYLTYIMTTVKYDENGNIIRVIYRNGGGGPVINDQYDNVYNAGGSYNGQNSYKFDSSGNQVWSSRDTIFSTYKILLDKQNNYYLGGQYFNPTTFNDLALLKYDSDGNRKWLRTYGQISNSHNDDFIDMICDTLGNVYVSGVSAHLNQIGWDYTTIKYNGNGDTLWVRIFNPVLASDDKANSIDVDKSGNVFVTGRSNYNLLGSKVATVIYNSIGQQKYVLTYDNNLPYGNHEGIKVKVNSKGSFIVAGNSMNNSGIYDVVIIKYSPVTGIQNISNVVPYNFMLYQNFPNPFNSTTKIKYQISKLSNIQLIVFDVLGRELTALVNERQNPGKYEVNLDCFSYSSGMYFYRLVSEGNIIDTKKFVLIK
ncbi:MAG: SBBP repeat-containing protein [Ignavibacteria bacterium]